MLGATMFWVGRSSTEKIRRLAESTEVEINGSLTGRSSIATSTITRDEVTELRYLTDGLLVDRRTGAAFMQSVALETAADPG